MYSTSVITGLCSARARRACSGCGRRSSGRAIRRPTCACSTGSSKLRLRPRYFRALRTSRTTSTRRGFPSPSRKSTMRCARYATASKNSSPTSTPIWTTSARDSMTRGASMTTPSRRVKPKTDAKSDRPRRASLNITSNGSRNSAVLPRRDMPEKKPGSPRAATTSSSRNSPLRGSLTRSCASKMATPFRMKKTSMTSQTTRGKTHGRMTSPASSPPTNVSPKPQTTAKPIS